MPEYVSTELLNLLRTLGPYGVRRRVFTQLMPGAMAVTLLDGLHAVAKSGYSYAS